MKPIGARTWGLDDPGLVGLGRVAVTLPVGEALHHLAAAAADKTLVMLGAGARGWGRKGGGRGKGSRRRRYGYKYLARAATRSGRLGLIRLIWGSTDWALVVWLAFLATASCWASWAEI